MAPPKGWRGAGAIVQAMDWPVISQYVKSLTKRGIPVETPTPESAVSAAADLIDQGCSVIVATDPVYDELTETDTVARGLIELVPGDKLEFLCDFYSYDGEFKDSYLLGEPMTVTENMEISNTYLGDGGAVALYRFTDLYNQHYWTEEVPQ